MDRASLTAFDGLVQRVQACRACQSMEGRRRVFSRANGEPGSRILFLAEAPGRHGGEITGVPLSRDQSGKRFQKLLELAGLRREQVFISNAVLCNPRDRRGNNRPPAPGELVRCSSWLEETVRLVDPEVIVTLGATALAALRRIEVHDLALRRSVGQPVRWFGRFVYPLYHPSPQAALSRPYAQQDDDARLLGEWLRDQRICSEIDRRSARS
jgi:uracil-DNA glycosylase family 4